MDDLLHTMIPFTSHFVCFHVTCSLKSTVYDCRKVEDPPTSRHGDGVQIRIFYSSFGHLIDLHRYDSEAV